MKILTILTLTAELLSPFAGRTIKNDRVFNTTYPDSSYAQVSYEYSVDNPLQADASVFQWNIYGTYYMTIYVNFKKEFDLINFTIGLTTPYDTTYNLNYAVVNGYALSSNTQHNTITIEARNTDLVEIHLVWDNTMVRKMYHYYWEDNMLVGALTSADLIETDWVQNGYNYVDVLSFRVNSYTLSTDPLATLETTTGNIYTVIDGIGDSIDSINTTVDNIYDSLSSISSYLYTLSNADYSYAIANQWLAGVISSQSHIYDMSYEYFNNSSGPANPNTMSTYWFQTYNSSGMLTPTNYNSAYSNWFNTKIIIFFRNIGGSDVAYWINFPLTYYMPDSFSEDYQDYLYLQDPINKYIYCLKIHHHWNRYEESRPRVFFDMYRLSIGSENITTVNFNDYCGGVHLTNQPISTDNILKHGFNDLVETINNISVSVNVSNTQITNEVNEYNTNINNVYTIENNINTQLQNTLQGYTLPDNTNLLESLSHTTTMFSSVLTRLNGVSIISVPLSIALVGIILIAILG